MADRIKKNCVFSAQELTLDMRRVLAGCFFDPGFPGHAITQLDITGSGEPLLIKTHIVFFSSCRERVFLR